MSQADEAPRMDGLDVLRGCAVLGVLIAHVPTRPRLELGLSEWVLRFLAEIGWLGVDLFYVLSGFLISGLLFKEIKSEGKLNVFRFWWRRGLKIWPCYFLVYGTYVATNLYAGYSKGQVERVRHYLDTLLPNFLFIQNYVLFELQWPASWSIAVEEHFYFLLPLVLVLILRLAGRLPSTSQGWTRTLLALGCLSLVIPVILRWRIVATGAPAVAIYLPTHLRCDTLLAGVLLRFTKEFMPSLFEAIRLAARWLCPILVSAVAVLAYVYPIKDSPKFYAFGFILNYVAFTLLVSLAVPPTRSADRNLAWGVLPRALAWMGGYSYAIYLVHCVVFSVPGGNRVQTLLSDWMGGSEGPAYLWAARFAYWGLSILGGFLVAVLVERPILRWRDRTCPSGARPSAALPSVAPS